MQDTWNARVASPPSKRRTCRDPNRRMYVLPEIRLWRVAHAMHANIPRSVVRQPAVIEQRPGQPVSQPGRRELLDLALNILNLFVPPKCGARDDSEPIKCFRGNCSAFAAQHHEQFMRDFIVELAGTGGAIESERIRALDRRSASDESTGARGAVRLRGFRRLGVATAVAGRRGASRFVDFSAPGRVR